MEGTCHCRVSVVVFRCRFSAPCGFFVAVACLLVLFAAFSWRFPVLLGVVCLFPVLLDDCSVSVLFSWAVSSKLLFIGASNLETRDMDFSGLEKLL